MIAVLGGGIAGISASFHIGHKKCCVYEKSSHLGGLAAGYKEDGCWWEHGPHVSFTSSTYVRELQNLSTAGKFKEFHPDISNFYYGSWAPHPVQLNLFALDEIDKMPILRDFERASLSKKKIPKNYGQWLSMTFGNEFAVNFPGRYTRKYWTVDPEFLDIDWIGPRLRAHTIEEIIEGYSRPPARVDHYVKEIRYPNKGGFISFFKKIFVGANVKTNHEAIRIDLEGKHIYFANGKFVEYEKLINTLPLPEFIMLCQPPARIRDAAAELCCTSALLVNVTSNKDFIQASHDNWFYVYDDNKLTCRVHRSDLLSSSNAPSGRIALQAEVYYSKYKPLNRSISEIEQIVVKELIEMGVIGSINSLHSKIVPYANVIFDLNRRKNQDIIFEWLANFGLVRESDDLSPLTNWKNQKLFIGGDLFLAGRFGQWKYFWTDDCLLRGKQIANALVKSV